MCNQITVLKNTQLSADDSSNSTSEMSTTSTTEKSIYSDFQTPTFTERLTAGETGELGYIAGSMGNNNLLGILY